MTENDIISGCQKGRAKYQKALVLRYSPQLMTVARRYCRDDHAAKDVLQESFIRIFKGIKGYQATGSFTAWMRRIVINVALYGKSKSSYKNEQENLDHVTHPMVSPKAISNLNTEDLIALIQQLPEGFRDVFNLYVVEGYAHDEIADILNIAPSTSRSQLARARQKLQAMILEREKKNYVKRVG
jgi:RNA polymerase sigma factor (sigma-70 family)